ncbi:UDP-N-acetylmuramate:L-alanyl-gamma-D-glutamyl-meso-diaminopimelate ligase, partial [bacterium]|nr:UDP-N-acetylmuramate:L-alanyl-gamma-D-glutamyl-meso-diaminopimelate ligase [bacterium]
VIDDFAHHPTAVRETLKALRLKYPASRLIAVFEPRSATSRRKIFQKEYVSAFQEADQIWIASPFDQSRISHDDQFSSDMLVSDLHDLGKSAHLLSSVDIGVKSVAKSAATGDLIAVLSNGGFDGFIPKLIQELVVHY